MCFINYILLDEFLCVVFVLTVSFMGLCVYCLSIFREIGSLFGNAEPRCISKTIQIK